MYEFEIKIALYSIVLLVILIVLGLPKGTQEKIKKIFYGGIVLYLSILFVLQILSFIVIVGGLWYGAYWLIVNGHPIIGLISSLLLVKIMIKFAIKLAKYIKEKKENKNINSK